MRSPKAHASLKKSSREAPAGFGQRESLCREPSVWICPGPPRAGRTIVQSLQRTLYPNLQARRCPHLPKTGGGAQLTSERARSSDPGAGPLCHSATVACGPAPLCGGGRGPLPTLLSPNLAKVEQPEMSPDISRCNLGAHSRLWLKVWWPASRCHVPLVGVALEGGGDGQERSGLGLRPLSPWRFGQLYR